MQLPPLHSRHANGVTQTTLIELTTSTPYYSQPLHSHFVDSPCRFSSILVDSPSKSFLLERLLASPTLFSSLSDVASDLSFKGQRGKSDERGLESQFLAYKYHDNLDHTSITPFHTAISLQIQLQRKLQTHLQLQ